MDGWQRLMMTDFRADDFFNYEEDEFLGDDLFGSGDFGEVAKASPVDTSSERTAPTEVSTTTPAAQPATQHVEKASPALPTPPAPAVPKLRPSTLPKLPAPAVSEKPVVAAPPAPVAASPAASPPSEASTASPGSSTANQGKKRKRNERKNVLSQEERREINARNARLVQDTNESAALRMAIPGFSSFVAAPVPALPMRAPTTSSSSQRRKKGGDSPMEGQTVDKPSAATSQQTVSTTTSTPTPSPVQAPPLVVSENGEMDRMLAEQIAEAKKLGWDRGNEVAGKRANRSRKVAEWRAKSKQS